MGRVKEKSPKDGKEKKMIIYVGYVISDYATAVCMSAKKSVVKKELAEINAVTENNTYIKRYDVKDELTDLDCD